MVLIIKPPQAMSDSEQEVVARLSLGNFVWAGPAGFQQAALLGFQFRACHYLASASLVFRTGQKSSIHSVHVLITYIPNSIYPEVGFIPTP